MARCVPNTRITPKVRLGSRLFCCRDVEGVAITAFVLAFAVYAFSYTVTDPDLWGHVKFGQDTWNAGGPLRTDPYSYLTAGQLWINHEWLSEVLFWLAFSAAGATGLVLLKLSATLFTVSLVCWWLIRRGLDATRIGVLLALAVLPMNYALVTVRPHLFTVAFFAVTILLLATAEQGKPGTLWLLPPLFALWANLHGGFLAAVGVVALWLAARSLRTLVQSRDFASLLKPALPIAAALLATLLNPYGPELWLFLLRTATVPRPEITEWQALSIVSVGGALYVALATISLLGFALSRRPRSPSLIAVWACTALLPLVAVRHLPLFAVATIVLAGEHAWDAWERAGHSRSSAPSRLVIAISLAAALLLLGLSPFRASSFRTSKDNLPFPARAVGLLKAAPIPPSNLAVDFDWGEYVIWHLGPEFKVSVDGRRETVYGDAVYQANLHFMYGQGEWSALLDSYPTDLALVSKQKAVYNLMLLKPGWVLVYEDPLCAIFAREGSALAAEIRNAPVPDLPFDGDGLAFP